MRAGTYDSTATPRGAARPKHIIVSEAGSLDGLDQLGNLPQDLWWQRGDTIMRRAAEGGAGAAVETAKEFPGLRIGQAPDRWPPEEQWLRPYSVTSDARHLLTLLLPSSEDAPGGHYAQLGVTRLSDSRRWSIPLFGSSLRDRWSLTRLSTSVPGRDAVVYIAFGHLPPGMEPVPNEYATGPEYATLFWQDLDPAVPAREIAACLNFDPGMPHGVKGCSGAVAVSPDGSRVAIADGRALRILTLPDGDPIYELAHHYGPDSEADVRYRWPQEWSPDGRLLAVREGGWEGALLVLIDPATGERTEVPSSYDYGSISDESWSPDGSFVAHTATGTDRDGLMITRPGAEDPTTMVLPSETVAGGYLEAYDPVVTPGGRIRFRVYAEEGIFPGQGLYEVGVDGRGSRRLVEYAESGAGKPEWDWGSVAEVLWSPAGDAFVLSDGVGYDRLDTGESTFIGVERDGEWVVFDVSDELAGAQWVQWGVGGD